MDQLKLSKFDIYGTFRLSKDEVVGIENLVQELNHQTYLSRNAAYYPNIFSLNPDFHALCDEYEQLNQLLPLSGKPAFVVCEKMHELAIRVVNGIQQTNKTHLFQDGQHFDTVAQKCVQECADNLVRLLNNEPAVKTTTNLREETRLKPDSKFIQTFVEADNKKQLYLCANALPDTTEHLITPGRGSSKLGSIVQAVRQRKGLKPLGFTQIYYSLYSNCQDGQVFAQLPKNLPEKVLVMDDIIYQGQTLSRIKKELTAQGHQVTNGAVTATFYGDAFGCDNPDDLLFHKKDWANYIDIIPNQYAEVLEQSRLIYALRHSGADVIERVINGYHFYDQRKTADFNSMRLAEKKARALGADLYQVSAKISPAAVAYNQKIREQVTNYNRER